MKKKKSIESCHRWKETERIEHKIETRRKKKKKKKKTVLENRKIHFHPHPETRPQIPNGTRGGNATVRGKLYHRPND